MNREHIDELQQTLNEREVDDLNEQRENLDAEFERAGMNPKQRAVDDERGRVNVLLDICEIKARAAARTAEHDEQPEISDDEMAAEFVQTMDAKQQQNRDDHERLVQELDEDAEADAEQKRQWQEQETERGKAEALRDAGY